MTDTDGTVGLTDRQKVILLERIVEIERERADALALSQRAAIRAIEEARERADAAEAKIAAAREDALDEAIEAVCDCGSTHGHKLDCASGPIIDLDFDSSTSHPAVSATPECAAPFPDRTCHTTCQMAAFDGPRCFDNLHREDTQP